MLLLKYKDFIKKGCFKASLEKLYRILIIRNRAVANQIFLNFCANESVTIPVFKSV